MQVQKVALASLVQRADDVHHRSMQFLRGAERPPFPRAARCLWKVLEDAPEARRKVA